MTAETLAIGLAVFACGAGMAVRLTVRAVIAGFVLLFVISAIAFAMRAFNLSQALVAFVFSSAALQLGYGAMILSRALLTRRPNSTSNADEPVRRSGQTQPHDPPGPFVTSGKEAGLDHEDGIRSAAWFAASLVQDRPAELEQR